MKVELCLSDEGRKLEKCSAKARLLIHCCRVYKSPGLLSALRDGPYVTQGLGLRRSLELISRCMCPCSSKEKDTPLHEGAFSRRHTRWEDRMNPLKTEWLNQNFHSSKLCGWWRFACWVRTQFGIYICLLFRTYFMEMFDFGKVHVVILTIYKTRWGWGMQES